MSAPAPAAVRAEAPVERLEARAYRVPTEAAESDGTLAWDATTMIVVKAAAGGMEGLGYSYASPAAAAFVRAHLAPAALGAEALEPRGTFERMRRASRNAGWPGVGAMAASAVEAALWDLRGRLLGAPLSAMLGTARSAVRLYGSGGFTSMPVEGLCRQLRGWADWGMSAVKMKVGREPARDPARVRAVRQALGPSVALYADANGAYGRRQALRAARELRPWNVVRLEEPVSSDDLEGLRFVRERLPADVQVSAGEYGWDAVYFRRMLESGAVDVLQADATRCGISGFLAAAELCGAYQTPLSAHTAPMLHLPLAAALPAVSEIEWFADHVRIERMFFDGFREPGGGTLSPDLSRPGLGLDLKERDAEPYRVE